LANLVQFKRICLYCLVRKIGGGAKSPLSAPLTGVVARLRSSWCRQFQHTDEIFRTRRKPSHRYFITTFYRPVVRASPFAH